MNAVGALKNRASYARLLFWRSKVDTKDFHEELDKCRTYLVNPEAFDYRLPHSLPECQEQNGFTPVLSGDWDLQSKRIETLDEYVAPDAELPYNVSVSKDANEVGVAIGREGEFILANGLRTLMHAKRLKRPKISAKIVARHARWEELRKELFSLSLEKKLYQPLLHPDLDFPAEHDCADRFNIMSKNLSAQTGKLLDIGAAYGYFCHRFEDAGFECYAVENLARPLYFLKEHRKAAHKKFMIIPQDILEWRDYDKLQFEVVLALNVFHHFLRNRKTCAKLVKLLNGLQMNEMFFEPCLSVELPVKSPLKNNTEEGFVDFILENSKLKKVRQIGTAEDKRHLYKFSRE